MTIAAISVGEIADVLTALGALIAAGSSVYALVVVREVRHNTNSIMEARLVEKGESSEAKGILKGREEMRNEQKE